MSCRPQLVNEMQRGRRSSPIERAFQQVWWRRSPPSAAWAKRCRCVGTGCHHPWAGIYLGGRTAASLRRGAVGFRQQRSRRFGKFCRKPARLTCSANVMAIPKNPGLPQRAGRSPLRIYYDVPDPYAAGTVLFVLWIRFDSLIEPQPGRGKTPPPRPYHSAKFSGRCRNCVFDDGNS